jgi:hypothetical protein
LNTHVFKGIPAKPVKDDTLLYCRMTIKWMMQMSVGDEGWRNNKGVECDCTDGDESESECVEKNPVSVTAFVFVEVMEFFSPLK